MQEVFRTIKENSLFKGIEFADFSSMFSCLSATVKKYEKKEVIVLTGNKIDFVGIVLSGKVKITKEDLNGNQNILAEIIPTEIFGEVFACAGVSKSPVTVTASEDCELLLLNFRKIVTSCEKSCTFHNKLVENMLKIIAYKNLFLNQKVDILSKRSIREKIFCFFDYSRNNKKEFIIAFNREELASYLCIDRSALSAQLSRMKKEGLIKYNKNYFELLK